MSFKKRKIKWTLVYFTPTSPSWELDYELSAVKVNIKYLNSKWNESNWGLTQNNSDYRMTWNPVLSFERNYNAYSWWQRWIRLDLLLRGDIDPKDFQQTYALVISLEDVTEGEKINLHNIIRNQFQQYVPLQQTVTVKQKISI